MICVLGLPWHLLSVRHAQTTLTGSFWYVGVEAILWVRPKCPSSSNSLAKGPTFEGSSFLLPPPRTCGHKWEQKRRSTSKLTLFLSHSALSLSQNTCTASVWLQTPQKSICQSAASLTLACKLDPDILRATTHPWVFHPFAVQDHGLRLEGVNSDLQFRKNIHVALLEAVCSLCISGHRQLKWEIYILFATKCFCFGFFCLWMLN